MARPGGSAPPVSFKTVPGRHRTTKWNTARQYDYSGDDWGGYDAYDDYGDEEPPPPAQQQQQYSAPPQPNYPAALPSQQTKSGPGGRQMSFDEDERRQFSAGAGGSSLPYGNTGSSRGQSPAKSTTSSQGKRSGDYHRSQRDFTNPEQVPPPLNMSSARSSPAPAPGISPSTCTAGTAGAYFPPRKTSLSSGSPVTEVTAAPMAKQEKELPTIPFIRPSDIYKRIEAERERERRESESSGRSGSMDSQTRAALDSPSARALRPLSAVDEGEQESLSVVSGLNRNVSPSALPNVRGVSGFGSNWFGGETSGSSDREGESMTGRDPAAEILTERTHDVHVDDVRASPVETSSLQATPTTTRDPAAEILAERTHDTHVDNIRATPPPTTSDTNLHHQPSQGYRSVVERAFDHSATSNVNSDISRDNSRSTNITNATSVSRSDSESTNQISPIMSRVPSGNTAQAQRQQAQQSEPTIAEEEPRGRSSVDGSATAAIAGGAAGVAGAAGAAAVVAGYRRNFTPPSSGTSPARKPGLQTTGERRISDGLLAETITSPTTAQEIEASNVPDEGTQLPPFQALDDNEAQPPLAAPQPTGPSALSQLSDAARTGRSRADTDYSMRESDLADAVNKTPSPTQPFSATFGNMTAAEAVQEEKAEQNLFLRNHAGGSTPKPQSEPFATTGSPGPGTPGTPGSGRASPSKGRVRDLADKFQEIHNSSRRGSQASVSTKSSWSKFDDREALNYPKRTQTQDTVGSNYDDEEGWRRSVVGMPGGDSGWTDSDGARPEMGGREESFRPQLPGGWVSYRDGSPAVGTPVDEYSPVKGSDDDDEGDVTDIRSETTPRASKEVPSRGATDEVDLTPTTRKTQLQESDHFAQVSDAGSALGTSLLSKVGLGHKTRDFGSNEPAQPVEQPETQPKSRTGGLDALQAPHRPWLSRGDTGATDTTQGTEFSSAVSSVPPTPPAKDTPPVNRAVESDNYFSGAPLRTRASPKPGMQEDAPESFSNRIGSGVSHAMSLHPRSTDLESDRLRKEIARSLDPSGREQGTIEEDIDRTQDAIDAPDNAERVGQGRNALPPAEQAQVKAPSPAAPRGFLDQRFSFEKSGEGMFGAGFGSGSPLDAQKDLPPPPRVLEPTASQQSSPEIKPEMPYERPRSRGLHVMNADDELVDERGRLAEQPGNMYLGRNLSAATSSVGGPVSPISKSQENLHLGNVVEASRDDDDARGMLSPPSLWLMREEIEGVDLEVWECRVII